MKGWQWYRQSQTVLRKDGFLDLTLDWVDLCRWWSSVLYCGQSWLRRLWNWEQKLRFTLYLVLEYSLLARDLFISQSASSDSMSKLNHFHHHFPCSSTTSEYKKTKWKYIPTDVPFDRFVFEKTFATCLTLEHLQGALTADNVYMELLQVIFNNS